MCTLSIWTLSVRTFCVPYQSHTCLFGPSKSAPCLSVWTPSVTSCNPDRADWWCLRKLTECIVYMYIAIHIYMYIYIYIYVYMLETKNIGGWGVELACKPQPGSRFVSFVRACCCLGMSLCYCSCCCCFCSPWPAGVPTKSRREYPLKSFWCSSWWSEKLSLEKETFVLIFICFACFALSHKDFQ